MKRATTRLAASLAPALFLILGAPLACAPPGGSSGGISAPLASDEERTLYVLGHALGPMLSTQLERLDLDEAERSLVARGLADAVAEREPAVDPEVWKPRITEFVRTRQQAQLESEQTSGAELLDQEAAAEGAVRTDSGLVFRTLEPGEGESPNADSEVRVHYHGTLADGTVFDSSVERGKPARFPLNRVVPCWTEALQRMKVGEKARIVCPSELAYGERGAPPHIKPGATLAFEVELLEILE